MKENIIISGIPATLYGESADVVYLFVHGKNGNKSDAETLVDVVCPLGIQVLSIDLPEHGDRKNENGSFYPWYVIPELQKVLAYMEFRWNHISLCANSIGAYFCLLAFEKNIFDKALFVSPILDMKILIETMMQWALVSKEQLEAEKEIPTEFGEILSWEYYCYACEYPIQVWNTKTAVLYAGKDHFVHQQTVESFVKRFSCELTVMEQGEHWFHTDLQMKQLRCWLKENI